jgi:hypothetical protein
MHSTDNNMALVVDGPSLARIFDPDAPELTKMLMELVSICRAVIACRVTPGQKAEIVRQVRMTVIPPSTARLMFSCRTSHGRVSHGMRRVVRLTCVCR